jgi:hypothetical protein
MFFLFELHLPILETIPYFNAATVRFTSCAVLEVFSQTFLPNFMVTTTKLVDSRVYKALNMAFPT